MNFKIEYIGNKDWPFGKRLFVRTIPDNDRPDGFQLESFSNNDFESEMRVSLELVAADNENASGSASGYFFKHKFFEDMMFEFETTTETRFIRDGLKVTLLSDEELAKEVFLLKI
jgi:hypothetical protein